jgi:hypothetical protein
VERIKKIEEIRGNGVPIGLIKQRTKTIWSRACSGVHMVESPNDFRMIERNNKIV